MKVILIETVDNLGHIGDVVSVRPGYARNFLLPRKKAMAANERNVSYMGHQKMITEHKVRRARKAAEEVRSVLEGKPVTLRRKAGENGKLFGSVTTADIADALRAAGVIVNRKFIHLEEPIRKTGAYKVPVKLEGGLDAKIQVEVAAERG